MRFSVEEINNSTNLLPNVSLGYEIFDYCSDIEGFPGILKLTSVNNLIQSSHKSQKILSKVMAVVGPFTSTQALTVAPLFMKDFISMVSLLFIVFMIVLWVKINVGVFFCYSVGRSAMELLVLYFQKIRIIPPS